MSIFGGELLVHVKGDSIIVIRKRQIVNFLLQFLSYDYLSWKQLLRLTKHTKRLEVVSN